MSLLNSLVPSRRSATSSEEVHSEHTVKPYYEIADSKEGFALTVYLPAVTREGLHVTAENNVLRIIGRPAWTRPDSWTTLYNESAEVPFELMLEHDNSIDVEKIHAELKDGVLRASLPKAEALKPRKIAVN